MVIRAKWHSRSLVGISAPLSLLVLLLVFSFTVPRPSIFYKKKKINISTYVVVMPISSWSRFVRITLDTALRTPASTLCICVFLSLRR